MKEKLRTFFNEMADKWDEIQDISYEKLEQLLSRLPIPRGSVILDVGSGTGVLIPFLRKLFMPSLIVEMDIAERMLAIARRKFGSDGILYIWGDAESYRFDINFDAIICYSSFPHFEDKEKAIKNLVNFLDGRGIFAIVHTLGREDIRRIHSMNEITKDDILPSAEEISLLFKKNGLEILESIDDEDKYLVVGVKAENPRLNL